MRDRLCGWLKWLVAGVCAYQASGCVVDPDVLFRAALLFGSDLSVFLLENAAASL